METPYEAARRMSGQPDKSQGYSPTLGQARQIVNGLHDAAVNHSDPDVLKMAGDASDALQEAEAAHPKGPEQKAAVLLNLKKVDDHINNLGRKLGSGNDASNLDPAVTYASSPSGSALADTYAKECNY